MESSPDCVGSFGLPHFLHGFRPGPVRTEQRREDPVPPSEVGDRKNAAWMRESSGRGFQHSLIGGAKTKLDESLLGFLAVQKGHKCIGEVPYMVTVSVPIDNSNGVFDHDCLSWKDQLIRAPLFDPRQ